MRIYQQPIHIGWGDSQQFLFVIISNDKTTKTDSYGIDGVPWWIYQNSPHVRIVYEVPTT